MKYTFRKLAFGLCFVWIFGYSLNGQVMQDMPCEVENTSWTAGEELLYKVYYNWQFIWIPAGEVSFKVKENANHYDIKIVGTSYTSYDAFFKVRDYYSSKIDKETLNPLYFVRNVEEGKYIRYDSIAFDYDTYTIREYYGKNKNEVTLAEFPMDNCVQDMVSIMYFLRNYHDDYLYQGSELPINVFFDKEFFDLRIKIVEKGSQKIKGMGDRDILRLCPQIVTGNVFKEGDEMSIYVQNDGSKVPLLIESAVSVGSVKAVLIETKNTKTKIF